MRHSLFLAGALLAASLTAAEPELEAVSRSVHDDARTVQRISEVAGRRIPQDVVSKILAEDLDLLRGRRDDGSYRFADYERSEEKRTIRRGAIRSTDENKLDWVDISGELSYRLVLEVPSRRMLVARNRRIWIERIELDYVPVGGLRSTHTFPVERWIAPDGRLTFEFPQIAVKSTARIFARTDPADAGAATLEMSLLEPRLVDQLESPFYDDVQLVRSLLRHTERNDQPAIKKSTDELMARLAPRGRPDASGEAQVETAMTALERPRSAIVQRSIDDRALFEELQTIQDLLTGFESERLDGMNRLHQLIRQLRP
jgi:hypothetical protein